MLVAQLIEMSRKKIVFLWYQSILKGCASLLWVEDDV